MTAARDDSLLATKLVVFVFAGEVLGGAERGALDLARDLRADYGASVHVCALDDRPGRARRVATDYGIPWTCAQVPWRGSRARKVASLARFATHVRRLRPDVLVSVTNLPNVVCGLTWRATGAALDVWTQNDVLGSTRLGDRLFRRSLQSASVVAVGALHGRDWLVQQFGVDSDRVHVLPGVVELPPPREGREVWRKRLGVDAEDLAVSMLAHFHSGKDHATLLRAWRIVADALAAEGPRPVLLLAGRNAGTEEKVKALAFDLDLRAHIRFAGEVDDVHGLLRASELAVLSSRSEMLPQAVTEPMAAGLAVAGTDVPGIRQAVGESEVAYLAPPGDAPALAERLLVLARDPELRARLGAANAELIRSRQSVEATSRVYASLLSHELTRRTSP